MREEGVFYPVLKLYRSVGILLGAILIICSAFYFDTLIFSTEYSGTGSMYKRQVQEYIESVGVKRFAKFSSFDLDALADGILADNPHLSFASCQKKGKTLKISLVLSQDKVDRLSGNKKAEMIPMKELLPVTGYIRGGCCPVGMKKPFPTWFHQTCINFPYIYVSAGVRGLQIKVAPKDLVNLVGATIADITAETI